jgi:hypothetical protein
MDAPRLRSLLLYGGLIAGANWPVVIAQAISESIVKALAAIPVAGAAMLLWLLSPNAAPGPAIDSAAAALTALAAEPAALAGVAVSAIVAALGAMAFGAVVKAGAVAVIVAGEARARAASAGTRRVPPVAAARAWSTARFTDGCRRFGARFVRLGLALAVLEAVVAFGYASAIVQAYRTFVSLAASWWIAPAVAAVSVMALTVSIAAELGYRLTQLVVVADDCGIGAALRGAGGFVRREALVVARLCLAALLMSALAFAIALVAAAAFGLVSFVPVAAVAVLPLQAAVWVVRGLTLPFIDLAALAAYASVYGASARPVLPQAAVPERPTSASPARLAPPACPAAAPGP